MRFEYRSLVCLGISVLVQTCLMAAEITKKNGQVVHGDIQGKVVLKSKQTQVTKEGKDYRVFFYSLHEGETVQVIDAKGIQLQTGKVCLAMVEWELASKGQPPPDLDVIATCEESSPSVKFAYIGEALAVRLFVKMEKPGTVADFYDGVHSLFKEGTTAAINAQPVLGKILGELRTGEGNSRLIPALELKTQQGPSTVPLAQIVPFE